MRMSTFDDRQNDKFPCCVIYPFKYFFLFFLLISVLTVLSNNAFLDYNIANSVEC